MGAYRYPKENLLKSAVSYLSVFLYIVPHFCLIVKGKTRISRNLFLKK